MYCDTCMIAMDDAPAWKTQCGSCFYKENPAYKKKEKPVSRMVNDRKCLDCALVMDNVPSWKVRCLDCYKKKR